MAITRWEYYKLNDEGTDVQFLGTDKIEGEGIFAFPQSMEWEESNIVGTKFDKDFMYRHIGICEMYYRGFILSVMGAHSTYLEDDIIKRRAPFVWAKRDSIYFTDQCWIEPIWDIDPQEQFECFGSMRDAIESVDRFYNEYSWFARKKHEWAMKLDRVIEKLKKKGNRCI